MSKLKNLESPITVGIVGLGRAGWNLHLEPLRQMPGFKIVAVADPLPERCEEAAKLLGCQQFQSVAELLAGSEAKVIILATPSSSHYAEVIQVLEAGRHCIAEKPLALDTEEAKELVLLAREKNLGLFVHHVHLHRPEYYHLKQIIDSGKLGRLFSISTCWAGYARRWDWQVLKKNGGGQLNNTCPHVFSIVLPLLGSPVKDVFADLRNIKDAGDAEDHVHAVLRTELNVTADIVVSSAIALPGPRWTICGTSGTLVSDGQSSRLKYYDVSKVEPLSILDGAAPGRKYLTETLPWEEIELKVEPIAIKGFHENVREVLLEGAEQIVTPESAAEVVRVTNLVKAASGPQTAYEFAEAVALKPLARIEPEARV